MSFQQDSASGSDPEELSGPEELSKPGSPEIADQTPTSRYCREPRQLFGRASGSEPEEESTNDSGFQMLILRELKSMNERLKKVENHQVTSPASSSSSGTPPSSVERRANKITSRVRNEVRTAYKTLLEDEDFEGFDLSKKFTDKENQNVLKRLRDEFKTLDSTISFPDIRDATKRFFKSKVEQVSLKKKGKYIDKVKNTRRRNRICRKLQARRATLMKCNLPEPQKKIASEVIIKDFMSSESSGEEEVDGATRSIMIVHPPPWRGDKTTRLFRRLDARTKSKQSRKSAKQTLPRVIGSPSERLKPLHLPDNFWGFTEQ